MAKPLGRAILGPKANITLVGTDKQSLPLLAQIILTIAICDRGQAAIHAGDFGDGFSDKILVFCRLKRQVKSGQLGHFTPPKTGGIDHPLGMNGAFGCLDCP